MFGLWKSGKDPRLIIKPLTKTHLVLLCPNLGRGEESLINPDDPSSDSILEGNVELILSAPAHLDFLLIELIGKQSVYCSGRTAETYEIMHHKVELSSEELGGLLGPGTHK